MLLKDIFEMRPLEVMQLMREPMPQTFKYLHSLPRPYMVF